MKKLSMTLSAPTVALSGGKGTLTASVTNASPTPERVILGAFPGDPAAAGGGTPSTLATVSEPLRTIPPGATVQYEVAFDASAAAPGSHAVKLIPYSADEAPEDYAELTHIVQLEVPEPAVAAAPKRKIPWLWIAIAAAVLVIGGVVAFLLLRPGPQPADSASPTPTETPVALELTSLSPAEGPIAGGTVVQLVGRFEDPTIVTVGEARFVAVPVSDTEVTFTTPPVEAAGQIPLLVESRGERLGVAIFEYTAPTTEPPVDVCTIQWRFCEILVPDITLEPGIVLEPQEVPQFDPGIIVVEPLSQ